MMLAWRLFWREWHSGSLTLLVLSLALSVAIISGMLTFTGQVKTALNGEASQFLAADRVLVSSRPVPLAWANEAESHGLRTARFAVFPSMVFVGDASALAVVKAVSVQYPLRGTLSIDRGAGQPVQQASGPLAGTVWLDARLLQSLGASVGDVLSIGERDVRIDAVLLSEPDSGNQLSVMAPRLMVSLDDLASTGIVQPGSRVEYSELFAGESAALEVFAAELKPRLERWHRWMDLKQGRPALARALDRAAAFLLLAGSLSVLLAAAAAWMASREYAHRQRRAVAILKALGADARRLRGIYGGLLWVMGVLSVGLGLCLGWLLQWGLRVMFSPVLSMAWPQADGRGPLLGIAVGVFCLLVFVWPFLLRLQKVAPGSLLREAGEQAGRDLGFVPGLVLLCVLISVLSGWWRLGLVFLLAVLCTGVVLLGLLRAVLYGVRRLRPVPGTAFQLALASWQRHPWGTVMQVMVFSLALSLVGTVSLVRNHLLGEWQAQLPPDTPNYFLINIAPHEQAGVAGFLSSRGVETAGIYPMIRGRLVAVNGQDPVQAAPEGKDEEAGWNIDRELNLSWAAELPADNELIEGQWWRASAAAGAGVSVEASIAQRLGLVLGDRLQFNIGGDMLEAQVQSIRKLDWETMRPNFFFLFSPGVVDQYPATWMTSFYLPAGQSSTVVALGHAYPTVSVIDVGRMIGQIKTVIDQVSLAMQAVLGLMLLAGGLVLLAVLQSGLDVRRWEMALLKSLGAMPSRIRVSVWLEFALSGLVAGLLAAAIAEAMAWQVAARALKIAPGLHADVWISLPLGGAVLLSVLAYWRLHAVLAVPPARILAADVRGL
jgi:putative ABC transport system permease protein